MNDSGEFDPSAIALVKTCSPSETAHVFSVTEDDCRLTGKNGTTYSPQVVTGGTDNTNRTKAPAFEDILDVLGSRGKFQTRLNVIFNCFAQFVNMVNVYMYQFTMQTPDHWCYVPGREYTNFTIAEWKNITIPKVGNRFSKCLMYNMSGIDDVTNATTIPCQQGWQYDDTWFSTTAPSQMNWVCDNAHVVNDVMFYAQNDSLIIGLMFGYIGDMFGRRLLLFLCLACHVASRITQVLSPSVLFLFILAESVAAGASGPFFESALTVGLELTDVEHRPAVCAVATTSSAMAMVATGLLAWALRSWVYFLLLPVFCYLTMFLFWRWFPESPRWLACRGRHQEALCVLRRIAATNGATVPPFAPVVLRAAAEGGRDRHGLLSIFTSWNLFANTLVLVFARAVNLLTTLALVLSVGVVSVNPFLTVSTQGAAQLLAFSSSLYCASRLGRRWPAAACALLVAVAGAVLMLIITTGISGIAVTATMFAMQFFRSATESITNLQSVEVHPTCLRQITSSLEWSVAGASVSLLPYVVFKAGAVDPRLPFAILTTLNVLAAVSLSFLPESALQRLPETLHDAAVFGRGRRYWSWKVQPPPISSREEPVFT